MNVEDLRKLLEDTNDKFKIFEDRKLLSQYSLKTLELMDLINEFLSDEQKAKLFELEHFKKLSSNIKTSIIKVISDDNIKIQLIENSEVMSGLNDYEIMGIVNSMTDEGKVQMLHKENVLQKYGIMELEIGQIVKKLGEKSKQEILENKDFVENDLRLDEYRVVNNICDLTNEDVKLKLSKLYNVNQYQMTNILKTFSDKSKTEIILENEYEFDKMELIASLSVDALADFIRNNKEFIHKNGIRVYEITSRLTKEGQSDFIAKLEDMEITLKEKRQILATLDKKVKSEIDKSNLPEEYKTAIDMQIGDDFKETASYGKIIVDLNKDLEIYQGLDELIGINPMDISSQDKPKLLKLCEICPEIRMQDSIGLSSSTAEEYRNAEIWIENVLSGIDNQWSDIQKVAFIDNAIGKKISYTPDFDTEICNSGEARALWKIISSGYGVCNGIAQVEQYMLSKIGVKAEMVSSGKHAFLKLKDIELPNKDGGKNIGDTILDPTWNLTAHRYGGYPENFCKSYEEIRKHDIREDGTDVECHRNDEQLASATLELDEQSLREVFKSIGLADREGNFPIKQLIDKSKIIDDYKFPEEKSIKMQLELLTRYCPEFATCQNSTSSILQGIILNQENLKFNKCVVNRVYEREDESKRPVLYVYADFPEAGKKFYLADKDAREFIEIPQNEFELKYECYQNDMERNHGHRHWEDVENIQEVEDLNRSSGKVVAQEGDVR